MEAPRSNVCAVLERTFVITAMAREPRFERELVAVIRPPAIDTEGENFAMSRPVVAEVQARIGRLRHGSAKEIAWGAVHVEHNFEILVVERLDVFRGEGVGVESKGSVAGVPAVGAVAGAEID